LPRPHNPLDRLDHPLSETSPETHADATDLVVQAPPQPEPEIEPPIEGDRLGVPPGATSVIADYGRPRPSYVFLALVSILTLAADLASKAWAEQHLDGSTVAEIWKNHVTLLLAKNRGGAWGLLQSTSENVRRPFFLLVSVAAIAFIMTLYRRLQGHQRALKWGLPLVLGGALGNVFDRIRYGHVIDFIDYRADWMRRMNEVLLHNSNDHWPTFNVADVAICVGVGLMAIDMFTSKRGQRPLLHAPLVPPAQSGEISVDWKGVPASLDSSAIDVAPAPVAAEGPAATVAPDELPRAEAPPADVPPRE
jgi:signal peptidase II